jgi:CubicO group peptidase (beta-lactamase class C family)
VFDLSQLQPWLEHSRNAHNVVGASLAVYANGREYLAASGLLNIETGLDVTTDSAFQIGSITKVFTATLLMQLVDEGSLDIEQPVQHYLPALPSSN